MSDTIRRFRGLILSLTVLVILAGCTTTDLQIQKKKKPLRLFNREYYAVKKSDQIRHQEDEEPDGIRR